MTYGELPYGELPYAGELTGTYVPVGLATETDTAGSFGFVQTLTLNQAVETDTASTVVATGVLTRALGLAAEADAAGSMLAERNARGWSYGAGYGEPTILPGRVVSALPPGAPDDVAVTNPILSGEPYLGNGYYTVDDDTGVGAGVGPDRTFIVEWDSYQEDADQHFAVAWFNEDHTEGGTLWTNYTATFTPGEWVHTVKVLTTPEDAAQVYFIYGGGVAYMSGLSIRSGPLLSPVFNPVAEDDTALPITVHQIKHVGLATETDVARTVSRAIPVGRAEETDTAHPLAVTLRRTVGRVVEADEALSIAMVNIAPQLKYVNQAVETDEAFSIFMLAESPYVQVRHTFIRGDGTPAEGVVAFAPRFPTAEGVPAPHPSYTNRKVARLVDGELEISLLEANPDSTDPDTWTYRVVEEIDNMLLDYDAYVDFEPLVVDLRELVAVLPDDGVP